MHSSWGRGGRKVKWMMIGVLIVSAAALLFVLLRQRLAWRGIMNFLLHGTAAFVLLYIVNTTGMAVDVYVPVNPVTLSAVGLLGVPGLAAIIFLKMVMI